MAGIVTFTDSVKYTYDAWGNLKRFEQDRNSAVGASGSVDDYEVSYAHAKASGGRVALRRSSMTLPSGKAITLTYSSFRGLFDDDASRVSSVADGSLTLANWIYNGVGQVVGTSYPEPNVASRLVDPNTAGSYPGLDRFNRIVNCYWQKDLTTPRKFYDISISWDKNSNITLIDDAVHSGFDVQYTNDSINRLTKASEGTWSGSAITSKTREQEWTKLSHTGNWDREKLDLNGDGDYTDTDEHDDTRAHNPVNEMTQRSWGGNNYNATYDKNGNLTDDGKDYKYEWDAFNRLVRVKNRSTNALVEEYRYNGLGFRIGWHADSDSDGDVDSSDKWYYPAYDEAWRMVAVFRESDTTPKEEFVPHLAGSDGFGRSSQLDGIILRYKDANTAWTSASDGSLEDKKYYCQSWRGDVASLVSSAGAMCEWTSYSTYGSRFGMPFGDADSDGDCDSADSTQIYNWSGGGYDVRGDIDLDGDVDADDVGAAQGQQGLSLGWSAATTYGNRRGYAGYDHDAAIRGLVSVRARAYSASIGRWMQRDKLEYADGSNVYQFNSSSPVTLIDALGYFGRSLGGGPEADPDIAVTTDDDINSPLKHVVGSGYFGYDPFFDWIPWETPPLWFRAQFWAGHPGILWYRTHSWLGQYSSTVHYWADWGEIGGDFLVVAGGIATYFGGGYFGIPAAGVGMGISTFSCGVNAFFYVVDGEWFDAALSGGSLLVPGSLKTLKGGADGLNDLLGSHVYGFIPRSDWWRKAEHVFSNHHWWPPELIDLHGGEFNLMSALDKRLENAVAAGELVPNSEGVVEGWIKMDGVEIFLQGKVMDGGVRFANAYPRKPIK